MVKLTKEQFVEYMTFVKKEIDVFNQLDSVFSENRDVMYDTEIFWPASCDKMIELIEINMDLPKDLYGYTTLSWWTYEMDWGKRFKIGDYEILTLPENHPYRKPDLSTLEKLYDFLVFETKEEPEGG